MKQIAYVLISGLFFLLACGPNQQAPQFAVPAAEDTWPDSLSWWQRNNLRLMQTNLPAYEAATLDPDSLVADLVGFSANTLIINAGGIMAFYPTELDFQYTNPWMQKDMLGDVIAKCHEKNIRVIVRFDFSRMHRSIFEAHPDWCYTSPKGERIINDDMYLATINGPYVQEKSIAIVEEVIQKFPIDGLFINMPGYTTRNAYEGTYHGIDQNEYDRKRFAEYSGGLKLPQHPDEDDAVYQQYEAFKAYTTRDWMERMRRMVKSHNPQIAICTYLNQFVDIIRHESQTNSLPYWPYMSSDNVSNVENSYPHLIVSNASIQQISFRSRFNAVEPEETVIRLYENIANGSGLDMSLMGDFRDYEDERNFDAFRELYAFHKQYEPYFGRYQSPAEIAVIAPGYWPGGEAAQEYRGIQLMLKEAHLQYDIIEDGQIHKLADRVANYRLIILPEITHLDTSAIEVLRTAVASGTHLIATNRTFYDNPKALQELFGAKIVEKDHNGHGFYLNPQNKELFRSFEQQTLLHWKFNLGLCDLEAADETYLPILTPGRPGPPEKIGGHEPTAYHALGLKHHGAAKAAILPMNLGRLYFIHGYEQHKNILLDVIAHVFPEYDQLIQTNAHPRVELVLQKYVKNLPENLNRTDDDGLILHLVNLTGFSGNTYFEPLPISGLTFRIRVDFRPVAVFSLASRESLDYSWADGFLELKLNQLAAFEGIVIDR